MFSVEVELHERRAIAQMRMLLQRKEKIKKVKVKNTETVIKTSERTLKFPHNVDMGLYL